VRVGGERITRAKGVRSDEARLDLRCPAKDPLAKTVRLASRRRVTADSGLPLALGAN